MVARPHSPGWPWDHLALTRTRVPSTAGFVAMKQAVIETLAAIAGRPSQLLRPGGPRYPCERTLWRRTTLTTFTQFLLPRLIRLVPSSRCHFAMARQPRP